MGKRIKKIMWILLAVFLLLNVVALFHAWKFTHFAEPIKEKTANPQLLSTAEKIKTLLFGISNPRPVNSDVPDRPFEVIRLKSNAAIECWSIPVESSKGTVVLFHGYAGNKSTLLDKSEIFNELGYSTLLVDFMGSGGSEGNRTTIGYLESEQVKAACLFLRQRGDQRIFLYGISMGAVATMRALSLDSLPVNGIMLECPFGTMYQTVRSRFRIMGAPAFPMAGLLVFWGGVQNGFWGFSHQPEEYAKNISVPVLLMHGAKDPKVSLEEIKSIYENLKGPKTLKVYPEAEHESYLLKYSNEWTKDVESFLNGR